MLLEIPCSHHQTLGFSARHKRRFSMASKYAAREESSLIFSYLLRTV
jgi:hypothetical protein